MLIKRNLALDFLKRSKYSAVVPFGVHSKQTMNDMKMVKDLRDHVPYKVRDEKYDWSA